MDTASDLKLQPTNVDGTTQLYDNHSLRLIPLPSPSPNDPLNYSKQKKALAIISVCFFGAIAITMQQVVAGMLPVFMLVYAGIDPSILNNGGLGAVFASAAGSIPPATTGGFSGPPSGAPTGHVPQSGHLPGASGSATPTSGLYAGIVRPEINSMSTSPMPTFSDVPKTAPGTNFAGAPPGMPTGVPFGSGPPLGGGNPLAALGELPGAQPLTRVNLLVSLPVLVVGLSNYILVPASAAFGRRPVLIFASLIATFSVLWSGLSTSLESHIASRCCQALGAGAVESLIPLYLQDMTYVHQRNRAMSVIWASQSIVTVSFGIGSSYIVARMSWRWLYYIGAIITGISALGIFLFAVETRWPRSPAQLRGDATEEFESRQEARLPDEGHSTLRTQYGVIATGGVRIRDAVSVFVQILTTIALPIVFYLILVSAAFIGISLGSNTTMTTVLLAPPYSWSYDAIGLVVLAPSIAGVLVLLIGGYLSDWVANRRALRNGGKREAEMQLWNMVFPFFAGIFGCILFGIGGQYVDQVHWSAIVIATGIMVFGFLTSNVIASVAAIESYPRMAGAVLVNVASFRNIVGFAFTYGIPDWVAVHGYMVSFSIFAGVLAVLAIPLPFFFIYGKRFRELTRGLSKTVTHTL